MLCEGEGWGAQERWGIGASWGPVRLRIPLLSPPPEGLILTLELAAPPETPVLVKLRILRPQEPPGPWFAEELPAGAHRPMRVDIPPCEPGELVIEFDTGPALDPTLRKVRVVFTGLMLCGAGDHQAQLRYLSARSGLSTLRLA